MRKRTITSWAIPLRGHRFDLEDLPLWFAEQDVQIVEREGQFMLSIPVSVVGDNHEPVREWAKRHLDLVNGIGRVISPRFQPVELTDDLFGMDAEGKVLNIVVAVGTGGFRIKPGPALVVFNGEVQPDSRTMAAAPLLRAASVSPRARDALTLMGRPRLTWPELYLLFELVEGDVGSLMFERGWISRSDESLFGRTANSYTTLGSKGRHGKDRGQPPSSPMAPEAADKLIRTLVSDWLHHLGSVP